MKKFNFLLVIICLATHLLLAQTTTEIKGVVKDQATTETLIGASITYADGKGVITDINGNYSLKLAPGNYTLKISYVGYELQSKSLKVGSETIKLDFSLKTASNLKEVEIVADVAKNRETPVAFSTIPLKQIQQELGTRDLPMVLNSTPGVYATESGGGAGDARINVRGFDQRNVAVMIDGVPFNDMENGAVYWSNWEGLGDVTGNMQVQRGLGASKLAIASVGGTINVLTKGIDQKRGGIIKQEIGNNNSLRTAIAYNTGVMNNGLGMTFALSKRSSAGWVDQTWNESYSYFFKVQKRFKLHLVSFSVNGAKQSHAQRTNQYSMAVYDTTFAKNNGVSSGFIDSLHKTDANINMGLRYNRQWGTYNDINGNNITVNEKVNFYQKPVFSLSDYWNINEHLYLSNVAYLSIGQGGGTSAINGPLIDPTTGQYDYQPKYNSNVGTGSYSATYTNDLHQASSYLRTSVNNHFWYGLLSTLNYSINDQFSFQGGIDLRSYRGSHWQTAYDLMGADYVLDASDKTQPSGLNNQQYSIKRKGDKIGYYYDGVVRWSGAFTQLEYKTQKFSAFVNVTTSYSFYKRVDYFAKRDLVLNDTTYLTTLGYGDTVLHNGNKYTMYSSEARTATTPIQTYVGYTFKTGGNYNIDDHHNVFMNVGYLKLPPKFVNVYDRNNRLFGDVDFQYVKAIEAGYGFRTKSVNVNVNGYYTLWNNKPPDFAPSKVIPDPNNPGGTIVLYYNINGMDALHKGFEIDAQYKLTKKITLSGVVAIGDWKYLSAKDYYILDINGNPADSVTGIPYTKQHFSAIGVHVGNAAQTQYSGTINYEPIKRMYVKARYTYFDKNYASFDPTALSGINANRDSWRIPGYGMLDAFAGYDLNLYKDMKLGLGASITNVLNAKYITDAQDNGLSSTTLLGGKQIGQRFNAESAGVFFGQGRRYNISIKLTF